MTAILGYIGAMIPYMLIALPAILIFRLFYNKFRKRTNINRYHEIGVVIFLLFMTALFSQTILTFLYTGPAINHSFLNVNIVPFQVFKDNYFAITELNLWQPFIINFIGNICIFMPIGFMVPILWKKFDRFWKVSLVGFCISLFIETTQLTQYRSSDIDDLWLNTLGCMIGYQVYIIVKNRISAVDEIFKLR
ncbi:VanZ family protein [Filibacter tadaridae]|uniref:VanZ like family protein n=1 Tax=Filibacter tadaridae TaxID=2483811 RepID=A0A3P5WU40_9BACL|nr:VanZ family protein [Filibacter tadaridae]VDC26893.1 VanZ like family protein [Filibacter tadaridae]